MDDMNVVTIDDADELYPEPKPETPPETPPAPGNDDLAQQAARLQEALRISEAARMAQHAALEAQRAAAGNAPPPQQPQFTYEQIRDMIASGDPDQQLQGIAIMQQQALTQAERHYSARINALMDGTISQAELDARAKYALEFELFGDTINQLKNSLPDKTVLTTPKGWSDLIAYVRGQDDNFNKLVTTRTERQTRETQANLSGFVGTVSPRVPSASRSAPLTVDRDTEEIARVLGYDPQEYARMLMDWNKRQGGPLTIES